MNIHEYHEPPPTHPTAHARARAPHLVLSVYARDCAKRAHAARAASIVAPVQLDGDRVEDAFACQYSRHKESPTID